MRRYWSKKAAALRPYVAGEQPKEKLIKLNTNENAYAPSPKVKEAVLGMDESLLRRYPDPSSQKLSDVIAEAEGLRAGQVFCANGSDEALALSFMAFFDPGRPVRTVDVTYSFYPVWAKLFDIDLEVVPLNDDFTVDMQNMLGAKNIILANPNAPTGIALAPEQIEEIVRETEGVSIIDEAYMAFCGQSVAPLIEKYENLAVVRTLSKSHSLAGLRVGYVLADERLIRALNAVKDSFNSYPLDMFAQRGAIAALKDEEYYERITGKIVNTREETIASLEEMGIRVLPSSANFIFIDLGSRAKEIFQELRQQGILVRHFEGGRTSNFLRVTIGTRDDMTFFIDTLKKIYFA